MAKQRRAETSSTRSKSGSRADQFRVGNVQGYLRGSVWYLCYHEQGRPRVGPDKDVARQMAVQINGQLEIGAPSSLSFEPISLTEPREKWLARHEHVLRSSIQTIRRYRTATEHLIRYGQDVRPIKVVSNFHASHAEDFVRYLRTIRVAPNGHPNSAKRPLLDKGIQYILETCRTLFAFAMKRRHLCRARTSRRRRAAQSGQISIKSRVPSSLCGVFPLESAIQELRSRRPKAGCREVDGSSDAGDRSPIRLPTAEQPSGSGIP